MMKYLLILVLFVFSCGSPSATFDKSRTEAEVRSMLAAYHQDIHSGGLIAEFKYLDSSDNFFWVPPGYTSALSYDSVRSILELNAPMFKEIDFEWETLSVFSLCDSIATYTGIVSGNMKDTSGNELVSRILESGTLIKRKSGWKLLSGQSVGLDN